MQPGGKDWARKISRLAEGDAKEVLQSSEDLHQQRCSAPHPSMSPILTQLAVTWCDRDRSHLSFNT